MSVALRVVSVCLLLFGTVFGFTSPTVAGASCGSVLGGAQEQRDFFIGPACADKLSARKPIVWGGLLAGGACGLIAFVVKRREDAY